VIRRAQRKEVGEGVNTDCGNPDPVENHDGVGAQTGGNLPRKEEVVCGHLYRTDNLNTLQIIVEGWVYGDADVDKM
jgi:hypothetical protein